MSTIGRDEFRGFLRSALTKENCQVFALKAIDEPHAAANPETVEVQLALAVDGMETDSKFFGNLPVVLTVWEVPANLHLSRCQVQRYG